MVTNHCHEALVERPCKSVFSERDLGCGLMLAAPDFLRRQSRLPKEDSRHRALRLNGVGRILLKVRQESAGVWLGFPLVVFVLSPREARAGICL